MIPFAYENVTVSNVAIGLTGSTYAPGGVAPAGQAFITVEDSSCRFRMDGGDPTSATGHLLESGDSVTLSGLQCLYNFKAIRDTGVDATLRVTYLH